MKAVQINTYGGSEVLELNENVQKPSPKKEQILVEVYAAAINPFDWKMRTGFYKDNIPLQFPVTLGADYSGIVTEVGENVSDFTVGDEVYGSALVLGGGSGAFAEFAAANATSTAKKPKKASFEETAASVLVGVSAVQALEEHIKLQSGQKILIHGGAGGIGSSAIQLAKSIGSYVVTTVSSGDLAFAKSLGADEVIDYKSEKFEEKVKDFDAVFDTVGGETLDRSLAVLRKGGILVSMLGKPKPELLEKYDVTAIGQGTKVDTTHLNRLTELIDSGKIKVQIDKVYPVEQVREAFDRLEKGSPKGKVVLRIKK